MNGYTICLTLNDIKFVRIAKMASRISRIFGQHIKWVTTVAATSIVCNVITYPMTRDSGMIVSDGSLVSIERFSTGSQNTQFSKYSHESSL